MLENGGQLQIIFRYYGLGFACIWILFALLHWHALRLAGRLRLTPAELVLTRGSFLEYRLHLAVCVLSIGLSFAPVHHTVPGFIYCLTGPLMTWNGIRQAKQIRALGAGHAGAS
jgi:hypothetical protein